MKAFAVLMGIKRGTTALLKQLNHEQMQDLVLAPLPALFPASLRTRTIELISGEKSLGRSPHQTPPARSPSDPRSPWPPRRHGELSQEPDSPYVIAVHAGDQNLPLVVVDEQSSNHGGCSSRFTCHGGFTLLRKEASRSVTKRGTFTFTPCLGSSQGGGSYLHSRAYS